MPYPRFLRAAPVAGLLVATALVAAVIGGRCSTVKKNKEEVLPDPTPPRSFVTITSLGGSTPVQAEGTLPSRAHVYFRARYEAWEFHVGATPDQAIEAPTWSWEEPFGDRPFEAGYMPEETARAIIESCAEMFAKNVPPPTAYQGMPEDEVSARRLARFIADDVATYHQDDVTEAGAAGAEAALAGPIAEGRDLYRKRVDARFYPLFEEAVEGLATRILQHVATHPRWLRDVASARSVATRWTALLGRLPRAEREALAKSGARWFEAWTVEGDARATLLVALRGDAGQAQ